jgi:hypothetical protein
VVAHVLLVRKNGVVPPFELRDVISKAAATESKAPRREAAE